MYGKLSVERAQRVFHVKEAAWERLWGRKGLVVFEKPEEATVAGASPRGGSRGLEEQVFGEALLGYVIYLVTCSMIL